MKMRHKLGHKIKMESAKLEFTNSDGGKLYYVYQ